MKALFSKIFKVKLYRANSYYNIYRGNWFINLDSDNNIYFDYLLSNRVLIMYKIKNSKLEHLASFKSLLDICKDSNW